MKKPEEYTSVWDGFTSEKQCKGRLWDGKGHYCALGWIIRDLEGSERDSTFFRLVRLNIAKPTTQSS